MRLHETLAQFADIVQRYEVSQYDVEGLHARLKVRIFLTDGSLLDVRETILDGQRRKDAYHWQDASGQLRVRWDNAAHWPQIETHPHHKHVSDKDQVTASEATTLEEVLTAVQGHPAKTVTFTLPVPPLGRNDYHWYRGDLRSCTIRKAERDTE